jgi:hypothetical protein
VFVSLTSTREIAAFRRDGGELKLQYTVPLHEAATGMVLTHDGQLLLAATGDSVTAVDVIALTRGRRKGECAKPIGNDKSMPGRVEAEMSSRLQSIASGTVTKVHVLIAPSISSQLPVP